MPNGWMRGHRRFLRDRCFVPESYEYLGPCRCGYGPHAFYRTPAGNITGAPPLYGSPTKPEEETKYLEEEAGALKEELKRIEERIKELKK